MKIQCNVCDAAEANVLCCADEAALCWDCDQKVHAANKLASKHQRVPLSNSSSQMPSCDICREAVGYFFCLEDRALLCRKCDLAIHTVNPLVSTHQRFLLTGVKVGVEAPEPHQSSTAAGVNSHSHDEGFGQEPHTAAPKRTTAALPEGQYQSGELQALSSSRLTFPSGGSATGSVSQWSLDEFLALTDHNPSFYMVDNGSSKCDSGKLGGDSDTSQRAADSEFERDDCLGQVPDSHCAVPQMPSPPTASGLYWPKSPRSISRSLFVPDTGSLPLRNNSLNHHHNQQHHLHSSKRRRNT